MDVPPSFMPVFLIGVGLSIVAMSVAVMVGVRDVFSGFTTCFCELLGGLIIGPLVIGRLVCTTFCCGGLED